jgi:hypothetical protein
MQAEAELPNLSMYHRTGAQLHRPLLPEAVSLRRRRLKSV